jgi:hypothetical protein
LATEDVFGWDGWERALDLALVYFEGCDDDETVPYITLTEAIAYGVGIQILREWARHEWALYNLTHAIRRNPEAESGYDWLMGTGAELRAEVRRLRHLVAEASAEPCPACGEPVKPGLKGRRYCSNACRQKAYRDRLCGKPRTGRNEIELDPFSEGR